jgi:hypothetical protein
MSGKRGGTTWPLLTLITVALVSLFTIFYYSIPEFRSDADSFLFSQENCPKGGDPRQEPTLK